MAKPVTRRQVMNAIGKYLMYTEHLQLQKLGLKDSHNMSEVAQACKTLEANYQKLHQQWIDGTLERSKHNEP